MAGSYNRGYVKHAAIAGTTALTTFVPVATESKSLSLQILWVRSNSSTTRTKTVSDDWSEGI